MIGAAIAMLVLTVLAPFIGTFFITGGASATWRIVGTDNGAGVTTIPTANGNIILPTAAVSSFNLIITFLQAILGFVGIILLLIGAGKLGTSAAGFHL